MTLIKLVKTTASLVLCLILAQHASAQFNGGLGGGNVFNDLQSSKTSVYTVPGTYSQTQFHYNGTQVAYADQLMDGTKYVLANITDPAGGTEFDSLVVSTTLYANNQFNATSRYFVPRQYAINPINNGPGTFSLYYAQADFDAYNLAALYHAKLPFNGTDSLNNKVNFRIYRSSSNSESANLVQMLSPVLAWNNTDSFWVVTFTVSDTIRGNYFVSSPFLSSKMVTGINHACPPPADCETGALVNITWDAVAGAQDYRMRFRPQGSSNWNTSTIATNSRTISNLSFNTTYELQLRVRESAIEQGEYTTNYSFTTPAAPNYPVCNAPASVNHQVNSGSSVTISWSAVANGATYGIDIKPTASASWGGTTVANTSHTFTSLSPSTSYDYRVRTNCTPGTSCANYSAYTTVGTFTTSASNALPTCLPPTNLNISNLATNSATLTWTSADNAQIYFIQVKPASSAVWGGGSTVTNTRTFNNLTSNTAYNYRIRTTCSTGTTVNSNSAFTTAGIFTTNSAQGTPGNALFGSTETASSVYPNPTNNELHVAFYTTEVSPVYCQLFDITGRSLKTILMEPVEGNNQIDFTIAEFVPGMYTLKVVQNNMPLLIERIQKQ
jgi:hypothetical protein